MLNDATRLFLGYVLLAAFVAAGIALGLSLVAPARFQAPGSRLASRARGFAIAVGVVGLATVIPLGADAAAAVVSGPPTITATPEPPTPSPSNTPSRTPATSPTPLPSSSSIRAGDVWRYGPDRFQNVSDNWSPAHVNVGGLVNVYAIKTHTSGCGDASLRQVHYWSLPTNRKKLSFTAAQGEDSKVTSTTVSGKVQVRSNGAAWSSPQSFSLPFGEVRRFSFDLGTSDEVLVSLYPSEADCSKSNLTLVYFDDQIEFQS